MLLHSLSKIVAAGPFTRPALCCLAAILCASLEVLFPTVLAVSGACISQAFPCLALSALALSRRFSGFRSLWPFEFISPRSALGLLLQSFLLQEIGCFFLRDFVAFRSSFRLLSLAATRSCYRVSCLNPVLSTTLQFDFRGFYPLTARSTGSMVSRLQWSMLSWFSILFRGLVSLCCALPTLISIGVAPLLRRRLSRFTIGSPGLAPRFTFAGWFHGTSPRLASSFVRFVSLAFRSFSQFTHKRSSLAVSGARFTLDSASCAASLRTYRLSLLFASGYPFA